MDNYGDIVADIFSTHKCSIPTENTFAKHINSTWGAKRRQKQQFEDNVKPYDIFDNLGKNGKPLPSYIDDLYDDLIEDSDNENTK